MSWNFFPLELLYFDLSLYCTASHHISYYYFILHVLEWEIEELTGDFVYKGRVLVGRSYSFDKYFSMNCVSVAVILLYGNEVGDLSRGKSS